MSIKIIEGRIECSHCGCLLEKEEPFKLNEFKYEIVCLLCDDKYNFSKDNLVICNTQIKQNLFNLIDKYMQENKTISIDMNKTRNLILYH